MNFGLADAALLELRVLVRSEPADQRWQWLGSFVVLSTGKKNLTNSPSRSFELSIVAKFGRFTRSYVRGDGQRIQY